MKGRKQKGEDRGGPRGGDSEATPAPQADAGEESAAETGSADAEAAPSPPLSEVASTATGETSQEGVRDELAALQQQLAEANDKFLRARAELENYRRRMQREHDQVRYTAKASAVEGFLGVFDHFQMAREHAAGDSDVEALRHGMDLIMAEFERALAAVGVERFDAVGEEFDPTRHEAMAQQPSDDVAAGYVLQQWKCGYRLGERLLQPATVVVSTGPADGDGES